MKTIEPRRIEVRETLFWMKEALELISRRIFIFTFAILFYIALDYVAVQAISSLVPYTSVFVSLFLFLSYTAFVLFFVLADMVVLAFSSDTSQSIGFRDRLSVLMPEQKTLFKMSAGALLIGAAIWIVSLTINPDKDVVSVCEEVVLRLMSEKDWPMMFIFKVLAAMLYFLVLALYGMRTFFSIPLVLFHGMSYVEARSLSHRAIYINVQPMSMVLVSWVVLFMVAMTVANAISLILFPLFGAFIYVSYRHIFIGQMENDPAKPISSGFSVHAHANSDRS